MVETTTLSSPGKGIKLQQLQIQDTENPGAGSYHIKQALGKGRPQIMNTNYEDQTLLHFKMVQLSGD